MRKKIKPAGSSEDMLFDKITSELADLRKEYSKNSNEDNFIRLFHIVRLFYSELFDLKYEFTFEELSYLMSKEDMTQQLRDEIAKFNEKLTELEFSPVEMNSKLFYDLTDEFTIIFNELLRWKKESKTKKKLKEQEKKVVKKSDDKKGFFSFFKRDKSKYAVMIRKNLINGYLALDSSNTRKAMQVYHRIEELYSKLDPMNKREIKPEISDFFSEIKNSEKTIKKDVKEIVKESGEKSKNSNQLNQSKQLNESIKSNHLNHNSIAVKRVINNGEREQVNHQIDNKPASQSSNVSITKRVSEAESINSKTSDKLKKGNDINEANKVNEFNEIKEIEHSISALSKPEIPEVSNGSVNSGNSKSYNINSSSNGNYSLSNSYNKDKNSKESQILQSHQLNQNTQHSQSPQFSQIKGKNENLHVSENSSFSGFRDANVSNNVGHFKDVEGGAGISNEGNVTHDTYNKSIRNITTAHNAEIHGNVGENQGKENLNKENPNEKVSEDTESTNLLNQSIGAVEVSGGVGVKNTDVKAKRVKTPVYNEKEEHEEEEFLSEEKKNIELLKTEEIAPIREDKKIVKNVVANEKREKKTFGEILVLIKEAYAGLKERNLYETVKKYHEIEKFYYNLEEEDQKRAKPIILALYRAITKLRKLYVAKQYPDEIEQELESVDPLSN
ncbi:MAG: hypothetical protein GWP09_00040 [Nitrospiraceae bacterium]|nr:hypothetical protein [Nitrospiraceae bacterium]